MLSTIYHSWYRIPIAQTLEHSNMLATSHLLRGVNPYQSPPSKLKADPLSISHHQRVSSLDNTEPKASTFKLCGTKTIRHSCPGSRLSNHPDPQFGQILASQVRISQHLLDWTTDIHNRRFIYFCKDLTWAMESHSLIIPAPLPCLTTRTAHSTLQTNPYSLTSPSPGGYLQTPLTDPSQSLTITFLLTTTSIQNALKASETFSSIFIPIAKSQVSNKPTIEA